MGENMYLLMRAGITAGLVLVVLYLVFNYGLATFTPTPYWLGVLTPVVGLLAYAVWPK